MILRQELLRKSKYLKKYLHETTQYAILILDYARKEKNNDRFNINNNANYKLV